MNDVIASGNGIDSINQKIQNDVDYYQTIDGVSFSGEVNSRKGFYAGFLIDYYFIDNIGISTGFIYSQKGYVVKRSLEITTGFNYQNEERQIVNLEYFDFPLLLRYCFHNKTQISGGLLFSLLPPEKMRGFLMKGDKVVTESNEIFETIDSVSGSLVTVTEFTRDEQDYTDVVSTIGPNFLFFGFQIGLSFDVDRFFLSLNFNRSKTFYSCNR